MDFMDLLPKGTKWIGRSAMSLFIVQARYTGIHHTVLSVLQTYLKQMCEISCKKKKSQVMDANQLALSLVSSLPSFPISFSPSGF